MELAVMAGFQVISNVGIHAWPVITLQQSFFCFVNTIMPYQQISMSFGKYFWYQGSR
jgi:hypothetical protein